jgi:hypothetical protein
MVHLLNAWFIKNIVGRPLIMADRRKWLYLARNFLRAVRSHKIEAHLILEAVHTGFLFQIMINFMPLSENVRLTHYITHAIPVVKIILIF